MLPEPDDVLPETVPEIRVDVQLKFVPETFAAG
jgi:hypothetical protein